MCAPGLLAKVLWSRGLQASHNAAQVRLECDLGLDETGDHYHRKTLEYPYRREGDAGYGQWVSSEPILVRISIWSLIRKQDKGKDGARYDAQPCDDGQQRGYG